MLLQTLCSWGFTTPTWIMPDVPTYFTSQAGVPEQECQLTSKIVNYGKNCGFDFWDLLNLNYVLLRSALKHYKDRNYRFQWRYPFYLWSESAYKSTLFQDCSNFLGSNFWVPQYLHFWSILCVVSVRKIGLKSHSSTPEKVMQIKHIPRREEIQGLQTSSVQC